jgi:DNA-directed RNA polymerase specialized sigma24 family protein
MEEFEQFVRARTGALLRTAYLLTGDRHRAEDGVQDTMIRVHGQWRRVERADRPGRVDVTDDDLLRIAATVEISRGG